jgi:polyisoprenoid-binding protein YceI
MTETLLPAGTSTWSIDSTHSVAQFSARHMMITWVKGRFRALAGVIRVDGDAVENSSVEVEIDVTSIDTGVQQRDDHLRSPDFLDVETFPIMTFRSTSVRGTPSTPGDSFQVEGELTICGATRPVTLDCSYEGAGQDPWGGERISFSAITMIDRRDFGLTWNQPLDMGGILVGNDLQITLDVQAVKD